MTNCAPSHATTGSKCNGQQRARETGFNRGGQPFASNITIVLIITGVCDFVLDKGFDGVEICIVT
jgi:hypothetical protein